MQNGLLNDTCFVAWLAEAAERDSFAGLKYQVLVDFAWIGRSFQV